MQNNDLRLLSLDGGGVRGLSSLMILQELMAKISPENTQKPCDYFDMIGGTSTGGLIAVMLGRLKMSIEDCIKAYVSLADEVFEQQRHRVTIRGEIQGRFDTAALERAVKRIVGQQGLDEETLLKDHPDADCKVFVCATSMKTSDVVCLTSYRSPRGGGHLIDSVKIWEACRATSAATTFFDPITIGLYGETFVDGALGANNPVYTVWSQAKDLWGAERPRCLVSIGTGVPSLKAIPDDVFHISETIIALATETEQTAEQFHRDKSDLDDEGRYYRFNVVRGLEDIGLEESKKKAEIAAATDRYINSQYVFRQMQACASRLLERGNFSFHRARLSLQSVEELRTQFQKGLKSDSTDIDTKDDDEKTALHHAAMAGNAAMVQKLIRNGAKIESEDFMGRTALHYAAVEGNPTVVKELLHRGAKSRTDNDRKTPLHYAAENNHEEAIIRLLLDDSFGSQSRGAKLVAISTLRGTNEAVTWWIKYGLKLRAVDCNGDTMLHWAASKGQVTVMQVLLEKGINIEAKNLQLNAPIHLAANAGHEVAARLLLDNGADMEVKQKDQFTPLFGAVSRGHEDVARLFLERGANTVSTVHGITALHTASDRGFVNLVRLLVESGLDVNAQSRNGFTSLSLAAARGDLEMAKQLLLNGADTKTRTLNGHTILHIAAAGGNEALVQLLLQETDIDVHTRAKDGSHPLITAAGKGHEAIVRLILRQRGTDVNIRTEDGMTALQISAQEGRFDVVKLLLAENGINIDTITEDGRTPLYFAASKNHVSVAELLLAKGANIMAKDRKGNTILAEAAIMGHKEMVQLLLKNGVSPKEKGSNKATPLFFAISGGNEAVVRLLLDEGASLREKTGGATNLHWAAEGGNIGIIKLLIQRGANLKQKNAKGARPVDVAKLKGHSEEVIKLLKC